ncbi:MAG: HAD family hydrolase [Flavobacteriaceae bacterium]
MKHDFKYIGFDADDTLWVNEPYYRETENIFCELLSAYIPKEKINDALFKIEMQNLALYGFGAKGFVLSMIETACKISNNKVSPLILNKIIELGKELINKPIILLEGVEKVLEKLSKKNYKLIVATKGDLLDQERKLKNSKLKKYFHHIEIMSDKKPEDYAKMLKHLEINPTDFLMIGNSLKSDCIPVLDIGAYAVHVPYHTTWAHEKIAKINNQTHFKEIKYLTEVLNFL